MAEQAAASKIAAEKAKAEMQKQLDNLGEANEDIDAIADRFNSRRLRES